MMKRLHPIMLAGTGSDVGKSIVTAALCRIFKQDGYQPAPFKAQNMALNSYATPDGFEIGRAQAVQAEAAGLPCSTDMNPILLKPSSDHTSQVVLNGKPIGNRNAYDYFRKEGRDELRQEVHAAFDRLAARYNPIVMEGAGSIAEINLRDTDLVNMPMARHANADVILVADIDRGGVFASAYGSIMLQLPEDRKRIKGIIINKFRGDIRLFDSGRKILEDICGVPVLGVLPYFKDVHIEEEDSVSLDFKSRQAVANKVNVAVVLLRHVSNFTDFYSLEHDERVHLFYTNNIDELAKADVIVVPGSKSTIDDIRELRSNGCATAILQAYRNGATVLGICGGYQIMGEEVIDSEGIEGDLRSMPGLGLLPVKTTLTADKVTRQVSFKFRDLADECKGYEIHMGRTVATDKPSPLNRLEDDTDDGYYLNDRCFGSYVHGLLDNKAIVDSILSRFDTKESAQTVDYKTYKEQQYDLLADHVRANLDMDKLYQIMSCDD
jgi:adenosylcobyric acid synthase